MASSFVKIKDNSLIINLKNIGPKLRKELIKETWDQSVSLTNFIIENHLTGGTSDTKLAVRTGNLRRTTLPIDVSTSGNKIRGGTKFGATYAKTHIGKKGSVTIIKPTRGLYLTIPIKQGLRTTFRKVKQVIIPARIHPEVIIKGRIQKIARAYDLRITKTLKEGL